MHPTVIAISTRLGPVFTSYGFAGWDLQLLDDRVEAYPLGGWRTLRIQFLLYVGLPIDGFMGRWRAGWIGGTPPDAARVGMRLYPCSALEAITVKRCAGANEVRLITREGRTDVFGILQRERTDEFRAAFRAKYPALYGEKGFSYPFAHRKT